jgi:hypothetical protein
MDNWQPPSPLGNVKLLAWLATSAEAPAQKGIEFHGYELHAHPDLIEPLEHLGDFPVTLVAAFGIPALAHPNGVIFTFAYGVRYLYFRNVAIPSAEIIQALGSEWQGLDPWYPPEWNTKSLEERLTDQHEAQAAWMERVRQYARQAYLSVTGS